MQHQLEDLSRNKFALTLPEEWVFRDKAKDYGIDGEVEIFGKDNKSTGLLFFVQLKATKSDDEKTIKSIEIEIEKIQYFRSLNIPVLIARYSDTTNKFYTIWSHEIDLYYTQESQKKLTINFTDSQDWDAQDKGGIIAFLEKHRHFSKSSLSLPIHCTLAIDDKVNFGSSNALLMSMLRQELFKFENIITLTRDEDGSFISICVDEKELSVRMLGFPSCTFHNLFIENSKDSAIELGEFIILGIASILAQAGLNDLAAKVIFSNSISKKLVQLPDLFGLFLPHLLRSSFYAKALNLLETVSQEEEARHLQLIAHLGILTSFNRNDEEQATAIEHFLFSCAHQNKFIDNTRYGHDLYNIGNFYRSIRSPRKAIRFYLQARRFQPTYRDHGYFYAELGGLFFEIKKYNTSSFFYKKALDLEPSRDWQPRYADALMHSGQYEKSFGLFSAFLESDEDPADEWRLKHFMLDQIVNNFNIKEQARKEDLASKLADVTREKSKSEADQRLKDSFESDCLCPLAWYNTAQNFLNQSQYENAGISFMFSSLISRVDLEGWANAVGCLINANSLNWLFMATIKTAYFIHEEAFRACLYSRFPENTTATSGLIRELEKIFDSCPKVDIATEFRIANEAGKMVDILHEATKKSDSAKF